MCTRTVRKHAPFHTSLSNAVRRKHSFLSKKKRKIHNSAGCSTPTNQEANISPALPSISQRPSMIFFSSLLARHTPTHTQTHTYTPPSRRGPGGWQRSRPVICQPPVPEVTPGKGGTKTRSAGFEACWHKLVIAATLQ